jgi:hypothetical protein
LFFKYYAGDNYIGTYVDDKKNGQGVYIWSATGRWGDHKYAGEFKDGKFHGQGIYYYLKRDDGSMTYLSVNKHKLYHL